MRKIAFKRDTLAKKLRRKDLRQPDEFVTTTMKIGQWVRQNLRLVAFVSGTLVVVVIVTAVVVEWSRSSRIESSSSLWVALNKGTAPVVGPDDEEEIPEEVEHFESREARAKAATEVFTKVLEEHGDSTAGRAARLGLAATKYSLGEYAEARSLYEDFLSNVDDLDIYKAVALEGAGFCYEALKNYDKALDYFRRLEKVDDGNHQDLAKYHQGRILEQMNKQAEAAELYRNIVRRSEQATEDMVTSGYAFERAEGRLSVIDPGSDVLRSRSKGRGAELLRKMLQGGGPNPRGGPRQAPQNRPPSE